MKTIPGGTIAGTSGGGFHPAPSETNAASPGRLPLHWRHIFVPVDFSEESGQALKMAAGLAEITGAKLTVLHVVGLPAASFTDAPVDVEDIMIAGRDSLDRLCNEIPADLIERKLIQFGRQDILHEIIETALELPADLMVVASHAHGGLSRILHPCISDKISRQVPCPVLLVHAKSGFAGGNSSRIFQSQNSIGK